MIKRRVKIKVYDTVHYIWVSTCVAASVASAGLLAYQVYKYFVYVKPLKVEMEERFKEELLKEGRMLRDTAQDLNN